ncbi:MAG: hypothetical protein DWG76_04060 [Chloroflexi bacterium]|nr:hypothetical protein [Chloroflexota bacterium]
MATASRRFQPYHGRDGDHVALLDFALAAAQLLDPTFKPPKALISMQDPEGMQDVMHTIQRWGSQTQGFETVYTVELEPRASGQAVDQIKLTTFGLPSDITLDMECTRSWYDPRFIEIHVAGPEDAIAQVIADFETTFGGSQMDPSKLKLTLVSAEVSLKVGAYEAAVMKAEEVLKLDPEQPDAYFVIGAAKMALGDLPGAEENLKLAVAKQATHLFAWFNLAKLYEMQGNLKAALNAYQTVLAAPTDPDLDSEFMNTVVAAIGDLMGRIASANQ